MRTLTTAQLDDIYRAFQRDVPLNGCRRAMTITEYYRDVWSQRAPKAAKQCGTQAAGAGVIVEGRTGKAFVPVNPVSAMPSEDDVSAHMT
jgi:hypothetical protein